MRGIKKNPLGDAFIKTEKVRDEMHYFLTLHTKIRLYHRLFVIFMMKFNSYLLKTFLKSILTPIKPFITLDIFIVWKIS